MSSFVGRMVELEALEATFDAANAGNGLIAILQGEAGIGKTRTIAEFALRAQSRGAMVLWGRCYEGDWSPPFGPWVEALEEYIDGAPAGTLGDVLGSQAAALAEIMPGIRAKLPDLPQVAPLGSDESRFRLHDAFARFLVLIPSPLVVVLDDLQWADPASLDLLRYVARLTAQSPVMIVGTYRGADLALGHPLTQCLGELTRQRLGEQMVLTSLTYDDSVKLLESLVHTTLPPKLAEAIYRESGGNPFFLEEIARHIEERGIAVLASAGPEEWGIPESVRQVVGWRIARLSPEANRVLGVAAGFTAGFSFSELQALTELDEPSLLDCVDEILRAGVIRVTAGRERYDFIHALVRHTLYDELSPSRRSRLHRRIAQAIEQLYVGRENERVAELASQYHASASIPGASHGIPYALAAAEHARAAHAYEQGVTFLRMARVLASASELSLQADILSRLAAAEAEALLLDDARASLEDALALLEQGGSPASSQAAFVCAVASALQEGGESQQTVQALIDRGLAMVGESRDLVWARLKLMEKPVAAIEAGPIRAGVWLGVDREAVKIVRESGDESDYAMTIEMMDWRTVTEAEALRGRVGAWRTPGPRIHGLSVVARSLFLQHSLLGGAEEVCEELFALSEDVGSLPGAAYALTYLAGIHGERGEFARAFESAARAKELIARLGPGHRLNASLAIVEHLVRQYVATDWLKAAEDFERLPLDRETPAWLGLLLASCEAHARARAGHDERARELLRHLVPELLELPPTLVAKNGAVGYAAGAAWELGLFEHASALWLASSALIEAGVADYFTTSSELSIARMATLLDAFDEASDFFDRARSTLEASGRSPLRAIVDYDEALMRERAGRPDALELRVRAQARFRQLGMTAWTRRVESGAVAAGRPAHPDGLTAREVEVLRLLASGLTNREMAGELVLSVHTVERHVANVYRKIRARNRADATAYTHRAGLVSADDLEQARAPALPAPANGSVSSARTYRSRRDT